MNHYQYLIALYGLYVFFDWFWYKGVYNQSYIEKDFFLFETFKERGCNFAETVENLYFKSWYINI